jgi:hypothetical protein
MKRTCFLHIGTEKTGTTSIQNFLAKNRPLLERQGILYPRSPGNQNHKALTVYALREAKQGGIRRSSGVSRPEQVPKFRERLAAELDREIGDSGASIIIFSNEHLSSRLLTIPEIERVKKLCDNYAERTKIIVYLRNQVDFLVSSFGTTIKTGSTRKFPFPLTPRRIRTMDYRALLEPWRKTFGRENLIARRFERAHFVEGDLLSDFAAQIPFDTAEFTRSEPRNEALGARELAFLREFNARVPRWIDATVTNPARENIVTALAGLSEVGVGQRLSVSPEIASAIMQHFEKSNGQIAKEYFADGEALFSPPQLVADVDVDALLELKCSDAMDIACKLWGEQQLRLQQLEGRRKNRPAQLMEPEADPEPVIDEQDGY